MFRRAFTLAARLASSRPAVVPGRAVAVCKPVSVRVLAPATVAPTARWYSEGHQLSYEDVKERVLNVVKAFDKVDASKVTAESNFQKDLGIDSLDAVELVMALEDEFVIEIPDVEAEKIQSTADAIQYISTHPHAK